MPKFGAVLSSISQKAGIKLDDDTLKKLLAFAEVSQFDLPDEFAQALERNLLTQDSAIANADVRAKIIAEAFNGIDAEIDRSTDEFGFDDTFKTEVKGIKKNTNEKYKKVMTGLKDQLKAAEEKAKKSGDPNDKVEVVALKNQITELNNQNSNLKQAHQVEIDNLKNAHLSDKIDFTERSKLATKPLPKNGLDLEINILSAQNLLKRDAAKHGLIVKFDEVGNPTLKQRKDGADIDFFVDNKKIDYDSWVDGVLAFNKFLQINDQQQQSSSSGNNQQSNQQQQASQQTNTGASNEVSAQLAQLGMTV